MRIEYLTKNYTATEKLKDIVSKKVNRLDKFFEDDTKVKVMLKQSNDVCTLELTIFVDIGVLRSEVSGDNMYNNIDIALPKLEKQIIKHHKKLADKSKKFRAAELTDAYAAPAAEQEKTGVVRTKTYQLIPMTVEDAVEELELIGHSFYVFENTETDRVNVLYRRNDGNYGLIDARTSV